MGNLCSCSYKSGWNKGNACPPGFTTKEDCGCFWDTISCEFSGSVDSEAVSVGARYNVLGSCTSDPTDPSQGGAVPGAAPSCSDGGADLVSTRYTPCCEASFGGGCTPKGWASLNTCSERPGDLVFDVRSQQGCKDKASGLSNNFAPMEWCKNTNSDSGTCWLPYSMNSDGYCFAYDKDRAGQWEPGSSIWEAKSKRGGPEILLEGVVQTGTETWSAGGQTLPQPTLHTSSIGAAGGVGVACLVGAGVLARKRAKRTLKQPEGILELSGGGTV
mmetsp:Transcript_24720/g.49184  ORF Transcript_24720/g.49184 Transcript_24720/m.49184 type:complete len:273 (+) Transcript_24720:86-904(+)